MSIEEISEDVTQIVIDQIEVDFNSQEEHNKVLYKYKNVLGDFYKAEIPNGKTFELHLSSGVWFDKKGQYHSCSNSDECNCAETMPHYVRKNNTIYMSYNTSEYVISSYIVDGGLFYPELYKE